ncbi:hypothetical protein BLOT_007876 [Blomia tropicalis]|nr:hypothetical protein BLOT_007876 [Blomia tropicalis]
MDKETIHDEDKDDDDCCCTARLIDYNIDCSMYMSSLFLFLGSYESRIDLAANVSIRSKITRLFKSSDQPTRMEIASLSEEVTSRLDVTKKESERVKWDNYLELLIIMSNSLALVEKAKALDISSDSESEEDDDQSKSSRSSRTKDKKRSSRRKHKVSTSNDNNDSSDSSESDSDTDDESIDELRLKLKLLKAKKSKRNKKNSVSKIDAVDESIPSHQAVKLIDKFKSEVGDWPRFKRSVETIVLNRKDVSDGIKSQMIQGLLTKESLGCWTKNQTNGYSLRKCWKKLSKRYEDSQQINLFLNSKILEMKAIKDQYDYRGLETISRQVEELNNVLNSLGEEKCVGISNHLLWRISDRFWSPENDKMYKKCKTMEQLAKYIADLYDAAVMFAQRNQLPSKSSTTITADKKKVHSIQTSRVSSRIESSSASRECYLCSEGHFAVDCTAPLSVEEKKRIVREKRLCTNCLRPGHGAARCFKKDRIICASCNGKHPTPLHGITVIDLTEQSNSNDNVVAAVNLVRCPTRKTIGTFHGHLGVNKCEIILDSGSVVSIISTKLASCGLHRKVDPILLVGFDSSMEKTDVVADVVVKYPNGGIPVTAYVSSRAPPNQLIIGLDYLSHMFKSGHRIWHTIFGDIDLEELSVIKPVRSVLWHNKEEPLDDCEDGIQLPIERVDSSRYQIKLPFFTDKRPSNNFELLHSLNRLQIRLQKDELVVYEPELMQFVVNKHIGIQWDMRADEFRFDWKFNIKRELVAYIGKCLDSLGIVDPVKLKFRLLFAKTVKLDSDDSVEQDALDSIGVLVSDTNVVRDVHFGRIVHPADDLNWFCDASESGYGCVIYIEYEIVLDKFKLAPKPKTIVELELFVMNEAVVAISKVIDHFKFNGIVRFLSDSRSNFERLVKFPNDHSIPVARRLLNTLTTEFEHKMEFQHIAGNLNLVDIYSRGRYLPVFVENERWRSYHKDLIAKSDNPIPTKLICSAARKTDTTIVSWLRFPKSTDNMTRFFDRILKWKEKSHGSTRRHDTFTSLRIAFQRAEESQPERWFHEDSVVRFVLRDVINQPVWIPKRSILAENLPYHDSWSRMIFDLFQSSVNMYMSSLFLFLGSYESRIDLAANKQCKSEGVNNARSPLSIKYGDRNGDVQSDCDH